MRNLAGVDCIETDATLFHVDSQAGLDLLALYIRRMMNAEAEAG